MCGIAALIDLTGKDCSDSFIDSVLSRLKNRGPDDHGVWRDNESAVTFFHTRLSIIDRSPSGHQPMESHSARYVISFNGEIYNHLEMKARIEDSRGRVLWNGYSDTEIFLEFIAEFGIAHALNNTNGMFAFCLFDKEKNEILMARDRYGQKPLYYHLSNDVLFASSDIETITFHPDFSPAISRRSVEDYISHGYIASPFSVYEDVFQLEPGSCVIFSINGAIRIEKTFGFPAIDNVERKSFSARDIDDDVYISRADELLSNAVRSHMVADVPVGVFLSGGIDSGLIAAKAAQVLDGDLHTFTIAFPGATFNEAPAARHVAEAIGARHHEIVIDDDALANAFDRIPYTWTEPFADPSQLAACILSERARDHVTVALSGDGGDEFFWGYRKYSIAKTIFGLGGRLSPLQRHYCSSLLSVSGTCAAAIGFRGWERRASLLANWIDYDDLDDLGRSLDRAPGSVALLHGVAERPDVFPEIVKLGDLPAYDQRYYLPDGLMAKSDRSSMAFGLEVRCPFLDNEIVSFASSLPDRFTVDSVRSKLVLRTLADRLLPHGASRLPKIGFSVPIRDWIEGPLKERADYFLGEATRGRVTHIDGVRFARLLRSWRNGNSSFDRLVWNVLVLSSWQSARKL